MFHIETVISFALQIMPGFYKMECCTGLKWVKREYSLQQILNLTLPIYFSGIFVNRTQNSSENSKRFWRLRFGRRSVVRPPSNGEGLRNIQHSMNMLLDTGFIFDSLWQLLQNATDIITKCDNYFITKCDRSVLQNASGFLLQSATFLLTPLNMHRYNIT